ncbi:MAG: aromatic ring-hydroxylating dioxygenase subunit alpha [Candidatus Eremiobacteraeota bacterium]|nr:aromatic ring-hydroxylating dioxygenase subunit alpha [Candidatus Eremiobacteraeota bacterium]
MTAFVRPSIPRGATTLERHWYADAAVFAQEQDRIFGVSWIAVGRADAIESPGSYLLAEVAGESLIVVRDAGLRLRAFFNVCRHRGTRLCVEPKGAFKGSIQCPYHAWTYGLDGSLLAARNMEGVEGFEKSDYPLKEAGCAVFNGFIFVNVGVGQPPFETTFASVLHRFDAWQIGSLRSASRINYDVACNWKFVFQNYSECYHCPVIHPQLEKLSPSDSGRNDLSEGAFLGGYSTLRDDQQSLTLTGHTSRAPISSVSRADHNRVYYYTIFPSMLLSLHPDYVMAHYVTPLAVDRTHIVCEWLFEPRAMSDPRFDPSDAVQFWDLTNRQDWRVSELSHAGAKSRAYTPGPYSHAEGLLAAFDRHYLSLMEG